MNVPSASTCPGCGTAASGNFCSACGASLATRVCNSCRAEISALARFCHRCGEPAKTGPMRAPNSDRNVWLVAGVICVLSVAGIAYRVSSAAPGIATPDMANVGALGGAPQGGSPQGPAPDISGMTPRERFDRLFNRIMQAGERGDSAEVARFTPMALGAYAQLDTINVDARYHAAVLRMQVGDFASARALADTILTQSPAHLFGYVIRGTTARLQNDRATLDRSKRDFLANYPAAMRSNRVEYLEHKPVLDEFRKEAEKTERTEKAER